MPQHCLSLYVNHVKCDLLLSCWHIKTPVLLVRKKETSIFPFLCEIDLHSAHWSVSPTTHQYW